MRYLIAVAAVLVGLLSFRLAMSVGAHLLVLGICWLPIWWADITLRPIVPCRWCDKGRSWDEQHEHFGEWCGGALFGIGRCWRAGKKLRWEVKLLRAFGMARNIPDPVAEAKEASS